MKAGRAGRAAYIAVGIAALGLVVYGVSRGIARLVAPEAATPAATASAPPDAQVARISATLFFHSATDEYLVAVRREVPLGDTVNEQGRQILAAELQAAPPPLVSVIPPGTALRGFYVTERGDAFVDLSSDAATAHPGGSTAELLTVYAIVNAVTANLPTARRVQILIDGKEVDTLAGHVDLRRPLAPDMSLVQPNGRTPNGTPNVNTN